MYFPFPKRFKITINRTAIRLGVPGDPERCPVAYAIKHYLPTPILAKVRVDDTENIGCVSIQVIPKQIYHWSIPKKALKWINEVDAGVKVKPISFWTTGRAIVTYEDFGCTVRDTNV